jgi:hypothetical protein
MNTIAYKDLTLEVRRSNRRRTVGITIERDGSLILTAPEQTPESQLQEIVHQRSQWIYKHLIRKEALNPSVPKKEYVSGEGFPYLGRNYRLKIIPDDASQEKLKYYRGRFLLQQSSQHKGRELFIEWYKTHLKPHLQSKVDQFKHRVRVNPNSIQIRELGNRWGSCNAKGDLYFHWRVAMLPSEIVNYVVVHEMAHLQEHRHNPTFWETIACILPNYKNSKQWLATQGIYYYL